MKKPLRWGILGTANIADVFLQSVHRSQNSQVVAIASRNEERAKHWAAARNIDHWFGHYQKLLDSGQVNAVYIPLPNSLHAEWCIKSLQAGLPVLCEKPLTLNAKEATEVQHVSRQTGLPVIEAFMYRYHPVYKSIRELMLNGNIGELTSLYSQFTFCLDDPNSISANKELGGGALMDVGCYCVHVSRLLAQSEPLFVYASTRGKAIDNTMTGIMEFPNQVMAQFECSIESYEKHYLKITGTKGLIEHHSPWFPGETESTILFYNQDNIQSLKTLGANCYDLQLEECEEVFLHQRAPVWDLTDAVRNSRVLDALLMSAKEQARVKL